jgi:predicted GTPase
VFAEVRKIVPTTIKLTSFSILMAQYKGNYELQKRGAAKLDSLKDGDTILIAEGCTHHRQCNDIGTVKLPNWIKKYTGKELNFEFTSGQGWKEDLSKYALIVHCGACMLNRKEMRNRLADAEAAGIPITNYGIAIAKLQGVELIIK